MSTMNVLLSGLLSVTDTTLTPSPEIVNRQFNDPTLAATTLFYDPFFQTINGTKTVNLPAATVWTVYVRNLSGSGNITVNFTPVGGSTQTLVLVAGATAGAGGIFLYFQTAETAGGITALSITAAAILPVCILVAQ
jgi:hypothetical protein